MEIVRLDLSALQEGAADEFKGFKELACPELKHSYTIIGLHCFGYHDIWKEDFRGFLPADESDAVRLVFVNATKDSDGCPSWHKYPDDSGMDDKLHDDAGMPWLDMLYEEGEEGMGQTDLLLAKLIDLESEWLQMRSERIILIGSSQGTAQSMLRFIKSTVLLGGYVGCVGHVPTAPHLPRKEDPLLLRKSINCHRPLRLLSGGKDTCFAPGLAIRSIQRLRQIGGFTDVEHTIEEDMTHYMDGYSDVEYLRKSLPAILGTAPLV